MLDYSWKSKSPSVSSTLTRAAQGREVEAFLSFASVSVSLGDLVLLDMCKDFLGSTLTNLDLIEFLDLTLINFYSCICVCICHMSAGTHRVRTGCQIPSCKEVLSQDLGPRNQTLVLSERAVYAFKYGIILQS